MMKTFRAAMAVLCVALVATLVPAPASAQSFELRPGLTRAEFKAFTAEIGPMLRFRQLGDSTTLARGEVEIGAQAANTPFDASKGVWSATHNLGRSISYPQVVARFGVSSRVDVGALGGFDPQAKYGVVGVDTKIALLRQADGQPVSVSIRPSVGALIYPSQVLVGTASVDVSVSRAFGPWSPYAGLAASSSGAVERSDRVNLDPVDAGRSLAFAGVSYRLRTIVLSAEVEKGGRYNYAFRIGKRF